MTKLSKPKALNFADNFIMAKMLQFVFERLEKIVGKGENAGYQHFFPAMCSKSFFLGDIKNLYCVVKGYYASNLVFLWKLIS